LIKLFHLYSLINFICITFESISSTLYLWLW